MTIQGENESRILLDTKIHSQFQQRSFFQASIYSFPPSLAHTSSTSSSNNLPSLPPHPSNPPCPPPHILPPKQPLHTPPLPRQLLITRQPMHKTMTRPTQPRHTIQSPLLMPAPLDDLRMHLPRDEMVVGKGDPVSAADLAG